MTRVLVIGATGMLGHTVFRALAAKPGLEVFGTVRSDDAARLLPGNLQQAVRTGVDALNVSSVAAAMTSTRPDVVVNCVGHVKSEVDASDPLPTLMLNAILPHQLLPLCVAHG